MRRIIMNIDDVGMLHGINNAALKILGLGHIASVSVMALGPWLPEFAAHFLGAKLDADVGVHLTLTSEWQGCRLRPLLGNVVPSLLDRRGYLPACVDELAGAKPNEIKKELRAQVTHVRSIGLSVTHLDTHMLFYEDSPLLFDILLTLATELDLPVLLYDQHAIATARSRGIRCPHHGTLDNYYFENGDRRVAYRDFLESLPESGVGVLAIHPSITGDETLACMGSSEASKRVEEFELFSLSQFPFEIDIVRPRDLWGL